MTSGRIAAALALAAALAASCAMPPGEAPKASAAPALALRNPGFETPMPPGALCPPGWGCSAHAGPQTFRFFYDESSPAAGRASGCIEPVAREPWAKMAQGHGHVEALRGRRVRLSALVRLDHVAGGAGLVAIAQGGSGNLVASGKELRTGTTGWQPLRVELDVPPSAFLLELGLVLEGTGRACMDEVRVEVL